MRRVIQVAPSNRLQRAQTVADLVVELREQHIKLNEALRQLSLLTATADSASGSGVTSGVGAGVTTTTTTTTSSSTTNYYARGEAVPSQPHMHLRYDISDLRAEDVQSIIAARMFGG